MGVTGYQVKMYADIDRAADALGRVASALEKLTAQSERPGFAHVVVTDVADLDPVWAFEDEDDAREFASMYSSPITSEVPVIARAQAREIIDEKRESDE